mmetsp:Transcript_20517/g.29294  ORF Transcript_20517/g.29294 Transcript_20517/m.29294 type:complete len:177 (+) Transcript_20517:99-629(+)
MKISPSLKNGSNTSAETACQVSANHIELPSEITVFRSPQFHPGLELRIKSGSQTIRIICPEDARSDKPLIAMVNDRVVGIVDPSDQAECLKPGKPIYLPPSYTLPVVHAIRRTGPFARFFRKDIRAELPPGIEPGQVFVTKVGTHYVKAACPMESRPGQLVRLRLDTSKLSNGMLV